MPDRAAARQAKTRIMNTVLSTSDARHVAGIGLRQREDGWVVRINLREDDDGTRRKIPSEIEGVPVVVEVTGTIRAQSAAAATLQAERTADATGGPRHLWRLLAVAALLMVIAATTATLIALA
ncbi:hypothetical protein ACFYN9_39935 [Streptomyces collinus]|uniref:hypothetical protein n=1 Tax=Streptomyces collinus TaxID=42684 RepID=UPI00369B7D65